MSNQTEWPQDRLGRFWRGLKVKRDKTNQPNCFRMPCGYRVGEQYMWEEKRPGRKERAIKWKKPTNPCVEQHGISLDILVEGLKELCPNIHIVLTAEGWYVHKNWTDSEDDTLSLDTDFRTAIIAAIEKLLEAKDATDD